jgi:hypothetical protein
MSEERGAIEEYIAIGVLAQLVTLCDTHDNSADFAQLRESTGLLPEILVSSLEELRFGGYLRCAENQNGNPCGQLSVTQAGRETVALFGENAAQLLDQAPARFKVSAPERSSRRGGKNSKDDSASAAHA